MNEEQVRKGRKSEQFMQDEVFATALEKMRNDLHWEFESSKPEESSKREMSGRSCVPLRISKTN
jgi:hypothetical protein